MATTAQSPKTGEVYDHTNAPAVTEYARLWASEHTDEDAIAHVRRADYIPHTRYEDERGARKMLREYNGKLRDRGVTTRVVAKLRDLVDADPDAWGIRAALAEGYTHVVAVDDSGMWQRLGINDMGEVEYNLVAIPQAAPSVASMRRAYGKQELSQAAAALGHLAAWGTGHSDDSIRSIDDPTVQAILSDVAAMLARAGK